MAKIFIVIAVLLATSAGHGQSSDDTISIMGNVALDVGVASKDYQIEINVSNHSFIVISISPVSIIRPLISRVTETVTIKQGESSIDYLLSGISTNAVDHVIDFRCEDCNGVFTPQYYTASGNSFSMNNSVYIDPEDFPSNLNFTLISGVAISGAVNLADGKLAKRDLNFLLSVMDSNNPTSTFRRISIVIPKGSNSASYSIEKLIRENALVGFDIQLECLNCSGASGLIINYPITLDASINNTDINFEVAFNDILYFPSIYYLLSDIED